MVILTICISIIVTNSKVEHLNVTKNSNQKFDHFMYYRKFAAAHSLETTALDNICNMSILNFRIFSQIRLTIIIHVR